MTSDERCTRKELEAYIGIEAQKPFFNKALNNYLNNPNTPNWNFAAFFLNMFWFMYRKSLLLSLLLFVAIFTLITVIPIQLSSIILLILFLLLGFFGTNIYLHFVEKDINKLKEYNYMMEEKDFLKLLSSKGGTSFMMATIFYFAQVILICILLFN